MAANGPQAASCACLFDLGNKFLDVEAIKHDPEDSGELDINQNL